jgi:hypothetical protein
MKKMILALVLLAITFGSTAMAHEKEIDKHIQQSFNKEFAGAADVRWSSNDGYTQVEFTFNNMRLYAYYNNQGETLAVIRNVYFSSLPLALQFDLKKNYKEYWITKICEVTTKDGTQYRVTLESSDKILQVSSTGDEWELIRKEAK